MPLVAALATSGNPSCGVADHPVTYNHMVVGLDQRTDRVFHALADATRRDIVGRAVEGQHSVSTLARRYSISLAAVQKHVAVLERAGLVTKRRRGREQLVKTNIEMIHAAGRLLEKLEAEWRDRLERFEQVLSEPIEGARP